MSREQRPKSSLDKFEKRSVKRPRRMSASGLSKEAITRHIEKQKSFTQEPRSGRKDIRKIRPNTFELGHMILTLVYLCLVQLYICWRSGPLKYMSLLM